MTLAVSSRTVEELSKHTTPDEFKTKVMALVGDLGGVEVLFNMVLIAIYIRPEVTVRGIIRPHQNVQEDIWQGKAGLVLKCGPNAFQDDEETSFYGQNVTPGEWCVFKVGDAWSLDIKSVPCRLVRDSGIKLKVKDPSIVF